MAKVSDYLKICEAAEYLGVSKDTLRRWDSAGKLKARRHPVSNFRLYLRDELDAFLATLSNDRGMSAGRGSRRKRRGER